MSREVVDSATLDPATLLTQLATRSSGLTAEEAAGRLAEHGPNVLAKDQRPGMTRLVWRAAINPLVVLLTALACISFATGDVRRCERVVVEAQISLRSRFTSVREAPVCSSTSRPEMAGLASRSCRTRSLLVSAIGIGCVA